MFEDEYEIEILLETISIKMILIYEKKKERSFTRLENNGYE